MKLKLSYNEFDTLYQLLTSVTQNSELDALTCTGLQHVILVGLYQKFYQKAFEKKKQYSINLKPAEAIAFYLFFSTCGYQEITFEGNLLRKLNTTIHQNFQ